MNHHFASPYFPIWYNFWKVFQLIVFFLYKCVPFFILILPHSLPWELKLPFSRVVHTFELPRRLHFKVQWTPFFILKSLSRSEAMFQYLEIYPGSSDFVTHAQIFFELSLSKFQVTKTIFQNFEFFKALGPCFLFSNLFSRLSDHISEPRKSFLVPYVLFFNPELFSSSWDLVPYSQFFL
jgi:hypothetical protein